MKWRNFLIAISCFIKMTVVARADSFTVSVGPEQLGTGGAYPMAMPPVDPYQWGLTWVGSSRFEATAGLCPGFLFGQRFSTKSFYVSAGGGLIVAPAGVGVGPYSSFGYVSGESSKGVHFTASYTQAIGFIAKGYTAPSSMRFGAIWEY